MSEHRGLQPIRIRRFSGLGRAELRALGTDVTVLSTDPGQVAAAAIEVQDELAAIDAACNRSRPDSELEVANRAQGHPVAISPLLAEAVEAALRAADRSGGDLDPTVGDPMPEGWRAVRFNRRWGTLQMPAGVRLDLGVTMRALAADRAAARVAAATGAGTLVGVGGGIATAGPAPEPGWNVRLAGQGPVMRIDSGGLAISSATGVWRTVSVAAASCVDASLASAAAIVKGEKALPWLASMGLAARLVRADGSVALAGGWPAERLAA